MYINKINYLSILLICVLGCTNVKTIKVQNINNNEILKTIILNSNLGRDQHSSNIFKQLDSTTIKLDDSTNASAYFYFNTYETFCIYILRDKLGRLISSYLHSDESIIYSFTGKTDSLKWNSFQYQLTFERFLKESTSSLNIKNKREYLLKIINQIIKLKTVSLFDIISEIKLVSRLKISNNEKLNIIKTLKFVLKDINTANVYYFTPKIGMYGYWRLQIFNDNSFEMKFIGVESYYINFM